MRQSAEVSQEKILSFLRSEVQTKGYPPSVREICNALGFRSTSTVHAHLSALEQRGLIRRDSAKPRALEILDNPLIKGRGVPLLGRVTAGLPILAQQNVEEELLLPSEYARGDEVFALRVEGESMIEAGILSGDIVIVRRQSEAQNGEIVVAMIEDEATVKRIFYEAHGVRLQPENCHMEPIYADEVTVLGRVVSLLRSY